MRGARHPPGKTPAAQATEQRDSRLRSIQTGPAGRLQPARDAHSTQDHKRNEGSPGLNRQVI